MDKKIELLCPGAYANALSLQAESVETFPAKLATAGAQASHDCLPTARSSQAITLWTENPGAGEQDTCPFLFPFFPLSFSVCLLPMLPSLLNRVNRTTSATLLQSLSDIL